MGKVRSWWVREERVQVGVTLSFHVCVVTSNTLLNTSSWTDDSIEPLISPLAIVWRERWRIKLWVESVRIPELVEIKIRSVAEGRDGVKPEIVCRLIAGVQRIGERFPGKDSGGVRGRRSLFGRQMICRFGRPFGLHRFYRVVRVRVGGRVGRRRRAAMRRRKSRLDWAHDTDQSTSRTRRFDKDRFSENSCCTSPLLRIRLWTGRRSRDGMSSESRALDVSISTRYK